MSKLVFCLAALSFLLHSADNPYPGSITSDPDKAVFVFDTITFTFSLPCNHQCKLKIYSADDILLAESEWESGSVSLDTVGLLEGEQNMIAKAFIDNDEDNMQDEKAVDVVLLRVPSLWWFNDE